jgi:antitoxin (DNA-binding transcriptional repressor) of toxin-antitoxin stability system
MDTITATELARDTRQILDRVAARGEVFDIQRHQTTVARLVPASRTMTAAQALAGLQPMLTPKEASAWARDSRSGFGQGVRDPWA